MRVEHKGYLDIYIYVCVCVCLVTYIAVCDS